MLGKNRVIIKLIISIFIVCTICLNLHTVWAAPTTDPGSSSTTTSGSTSGSADTGDGLLKQMQGDIDEFKKAGKGKSDFKVGDVTKNFVSLAQILTMVGAGIMVAVTTYMGIKYLTGGPEAQAKLKTQLIGVMVSGMVIFGAYFIWKTVVNIVSTF